MSGQELRLTTTTWLTTIEKWLIDLGDHLVYDQKVTLSELFLVSIALSRAIWYSIFGIGTFIQYVFPDIVWISVFWAITIIHTIGFFLKSPLLRANISFFHAVVWAFLTILAITSNPHLPSAASFPVTAVLGIVIAVRLLHDAKQLQHD